MRVGAVPSSMAKKKTPIARGYSTTSTPKIKIAAPEPAMPNDTPREQAETAVETDAVPATFERQLAALEKQKQKRVKFSDTLDLLLDRDALESLIAYCVPQLGPAGNSLLTEIDIIRNYTNLSQLGIREQLIQQAMRDFPGSSPDVLLQRV